MDFQNERIGVIAYLAANSPSRWIGRTALMKFCYFLQELRGVPLGYYFTLYAYGPFDSAVLSDLGDAEALGVVKENSTLFPVGYGYQISCAVESQQVDQIGGELLKCCRSDVDWVTKEFGNLSAADLELDSTVIFIDREALSSGGNISLEELVRHVRDVKPRFPEEHVRRHIESLRSKGLLKGLLEN